MSPKFNKNDVMSIVRAAEGVLRPLTQYRHDCHRASLALVKAGLADRVARGWCEGVGGQHSWAVTGWDCYDETACILDPTLWSYVGVDPYVWVGSAYVRHTPHGSGYATSALLREIVSRDLEGPPIALTSAEPLSLNAEQFLTALGPLDYRGWHMVSKLPNRGWPGGEVINAMCETQKLRAIVPIDIQGMWTMRNPAGVYMRREDGLFDGPEREF